MRFASILSAGDGHAAAPDSTLGLQRMLSQGKILFGGLLFGAQRLSLMYATINNNLRFEFDYIEDTKKKRLELRANICL
jgi:hypothetical protein